MSSFDHDVSLNFVGETRHNEGGGFEQVWVFPQFFVTFGAPPSPLTSPNVKNHEKGNAEKGPGGGGGRENETATLNREMWMNPKVLGFRFWEVLVGEGLGFGVQVLLEVHENVWGKVKAMLDTV